MNKNMESLLEGESAKIWEEIKNVQLDLFSLPGQTVAKNAYPTLVEPSKLYLVVKASAVHAALAEALKDKFEVELVNNWSVISRK